MTAPATESSESATKSRLHRVFPRWLLLVLVLLAITIRGRAMLAMSDALLQDPDSYQELARNLVRRGELAWQMNNTIEPTAFRPPLYPLLLAPFYALPHIAIGLLHVVLGVATVCLTWWLALRWNLPPIGALAAAALVALDPILINQSAQVMTETLATFLGTCALLAITRCVQNNSLRFAALAGCLFGLCVLCRPTFLVWFGAVLIALPFCIPFAWRRALTIDLLLAVVAALVLAPWAIRNQHEFGAPVVTTTHGGYTMMLANNPEFYEYLRSAPWGSVWEAERFNARWEAQAAANRQPNSFLDRVDEVGNDRRAYQIAWQNIVREPSMFAYSCLVRLGRLWGVLPHQLTPNEAPSRRGLRYAVAIWYTLELLLAAAGAWLLGKKLRSTPWIWGLLLLGTFSAVHALYWTDLRMRAPLVPVVAMLAAYGAVTLAESNARAKHSQVTT